MVSIPGGELAGFWELAGGGNFYNVLPAPGGEALVVIAGETGCSTSRCRPASNAASTKGKRL